MQLTLGQQIRQLRKSRSLSTAALAKQIGKSAGFVNNAERDLTEVSISALQSISNALDVQISWFFQGREQAAGNETGLIIRRGQGKKLQFNAGAIQEEILSPQQAQQCKIIQTTFAPGSNSGEQAIYQDAERSGYILAGKLQLSIGDQSYQLDSGDSFVIPAGQSHYSDNPYPQTCVSLWIISPAVY